MCHSENRHDDKQNKNRWGLVYWTLENTYGHGYRKPLGARKLWTLLGKHIWRQTKKRWRMQNLVLRNGYSDKEMDR